MGVNNSRTSRRMSDTDEESDHSRPHGILRASSLENLVDDSGDLPSLVAYLIRSGQIQFINQVNGDSDSPPSEEEFSTPPIQPPTVEKSPNISKIQNNDIYPLIMKSSGRLSDKTWLSYLRPTIPNMIFKREAGMNQQQQFTHGDMCVINSRCIPNQSSLLASYNYKAFCGIYSEDGDVFLSACQDQHIRVYDTKEDKFRQIQCVRARDVGWSVLDTAFSPDGQYAAYSSWSDCIHLCSINEDLDVHETLHFEPGDSIYMSFCIFSLMFSSDNKEILGGANDGHLYVYDRELNKRTLKIDAHDCDLNTVRFADSSSHILYSGGDDGLCKSITEMINKAVGRDTWPSMFVDRAHDDEDSDKLNVWDRRALREERPIPVGVLAGHSDGITYIDSKGDARFLITNCKDQSIKLWDIRHFSDQDGINETKKTVSSQRWDYRWQQVPQKVGRRRSLKGDSSVMTYKGHCVLHTLIRCKFSPEATTGQRYIYTGCATGNVLVYDLLTGKVVRKLEGHTSCVRDVSWHPYKNIIVSTSWDGQLLKWTYNGLIEPDQEQPKPRRIRPVVNSRLPSGMNRASPKSFAKEVPFPRLYD